MAANKLILMGLIKPSQDAREAFNEWYLGNHVEDTFNCPNISAVRCFKAVRGYLGDPPGEYLTIYEFTGDDAVEAERILEQYQADPDAWSKRQPANDSVEVIGCGWYAEEISFP